MMLFLFMQCVRSYYQRRDKRENMTNIIEALGESGMPVVFPVHPRTEKYLREYGLLERMPGNVKLIEPLGYLENFRKVLTKDGVCKTLGKVYQKTLRKFYQMRGMVRHTPTPHKARFRFCAIPLYVIKGRNPFWICLC